MNRWMLVLSSVMPLVACATHVVVVDDALELEDGRTRLIAHVERAHGPFYSGIENAEVRFRVEGREVATALTDDRGVALALAELGDEPSKFTATTRVGGNDLESEGTVTQWRSDRTLVACDIDATISNTDLEALFFDKVDDSSTPIAGSVDVLHEIAQHHDLIYFTARPRFTLDKTREWLEAHAYPKAPVMTALTIGDSLAQKHYKERELGKIRELFPNLLIGIGNSPIDAHGYGANGMLTLIVNEPAVTTYDSHVVEFHAWSQLRRFMQTNRDTLQDPEKTRSALKGETMLFLPVLPWVPADGDG